MGLTINSVWLSTLSIWMLDILLSCVHCLPNNLNCLSVQKVLLHIVYLAVSTDGFLYYFSDYPDGPCGIIDGSPDFCQSVQNVCPDI